MTADNPARSQVQREITRIALSGIGPAGFVLAGSGAIREHGLISRPTEDVDLFTVAAAADRFPAAVDRLITDLRGAGYTVQVIRRSGTFARLHVRNETVQMEVDLGIDWRRDDPVIFDIGPVLSLDDAVGNKIAALYSRGEPRDYLDVDAIRRSRRFTDQQLLAAAAERDHLRPATRRGPTDHTGRRRPLRHRRRDPPRRRRKVHGLGRPAPHRPVRRQLTATTECDRHTVQSEHGKSPE